MWAISRRQNLHMKRSGARGYASKIDGNLLQTAVELHGLDSINDTKGFGYKQQQTAAWDNITAYYNRFVPDTEQRTKLQLQNCTLRNYRKASKRRLIY